MIFLGLIFGPETLGGFVGGPKDFFWFWYFCPPLYHSHHLNSQYPAQPSGPGDGMLDPPHVT